MEKCNVCKNPLPPFNGMCEGCEGCVNISTVLSFTHSHGGKFSHKIEKKELAIHGRCLEGFQKMSLAQLRGPQREVRI
jgi:hypothetical protein